MVDAITNAVGGWLAWFAGGTDGYMKLGHCMRGDTFWIVLTVVLDLTVAAGYVVIARHWARNEGLLAQSPAKSALSNMKRIFILCGVCGYLYIPIKMFWPAWRLYDLVLLWLIYYTWKYALSSRELRVVYEQLDKTDQLSRELEESRHEARRRSIFLSSISHDIRTPLNGLSLQAELAEIHLAAGDAESLRQSLEEIRQCARSAGDLLGEFLELGRLDWAGQDICRDWFSLDEAVSRVIEASRTSAANKGLSLEYEGASSVTVHSDRRLIDRILRNLVENGIKYTAAGGVRIAVAIGPSTLEIHVIDTGVGIAAEHQALVFQDFFQVNNRERDRSKGFGLGLAIAARLARQLGGDLALESELGRGSRFILRLPRELPNTEAFDESGHTLSLTARATASFAR